MIPGALNNYGENNMHNYYHSNNQNQSVFHVNPLEIKNWNDIISEYSNASFFHTKEWCETLVKSYHFEPIYLHKVCNSGLNIYPLMGVKDFSGKNKLVSLPFTDYCDPLSAEKIYIDNNKNIFFKYFNHTEFKRIDFKSSLILNNEAEHLDTDKIHLLSLINPDELLKKFSHTTRSNINKAERTGINIKIDNSLIGIEEFYRLQCITRKRHNLPPQPLNFFINLYNFAFKKNMADIFLAFYKNKVIASGLFLKFKDKVLFKYANSDHNYQSFRPNNLLVWEAIKYYYDKGFKIFDFGKTESENEGLRKYKLGFNTIEKPLFNYYYDLNASRFVIKNQIKHYPIIFKYAPVSHLKILSKFIYGFFA